MDFQAFEQKLATYAGDLPALGTKLTNGLKAIQASPFETYIEARWPTAKAIEDKAIADIGFLSNLDSELVTWLDVLFPKVPA